MNYCFRICKPVAFATVARVYIYHVLVVEGPYKTVVRQNPVQNLPVSYNVKSWRSLVRSKAVRTSSLLGVRDFRSRTLKPQPQTYNGILKLEKIDEMHEVQYS